MRVKRHIRVQSSRYRICFLSPPPSLSLSLSLSLSCTDTHAGKENEKDENEERQKARRYLRLFGSLGAIGRDHAINRAIQPND